MEAEELKNSHLKRELDTLTDKCQNLTTAVRALEREVQTERATQQNFNLAERTQRMQENYTNLRGTMTTYYDQIRNSLPLLMLMAGQGDNMRLRDLIPVLMGTMGEFQNGEQVTPT